MDVLRILIIGLWGCIVGSVIAYICAFIQYAKQRKGTDKKVSGIISIIIIFMILLVGLFVLNVISFQSYHKKGITTIVPLDSLCFMIIGSVLLSISCFSFVQLHRYKIGKLFAFYALLIGLSIMLAPCNQINGTLISTARAVFSLGSSILLFRVIGYLTLLVRKKMFRIMQIVLVFVIIIGMIAQICSLLSLENQWIYILAEESISGSIILSAIFCLIIMSIYYKSSNGYARKQSRTLIHGIGAGLLLYWIASIVPNIYMVQNEQMESKYFVELSMAPAETMATSIPLLLFSGVSIAIIFMLLHREFVLCDVRLKIKYFISIPLYVLMLNILIIIYTNSSLYLLILIDCFWLLPFIWCIQKVLYPVKQEEEQMYQWKLMEAVEREKQELAVYLHDEVLQLLIAFYRKVQTDESSRYIGIKESLSNLIAQIRDVSHNLYPTMVEDLGLEQSLSVFVRRIEESYPTVKITCDYTLADGILPKAFAIVLYRISKELVTNAVKHSECAEVFLAFSEDADGYYISVRDDGHGFCFPQNSELLKSPHMGLYTIRRQVAELKGHMKFESDFQSGTYYQIYFPKKEE